jgi:hypothetical protein
MIVGPETGVYQLRSRSCLTVGSGFLLVSGRLVRVGSCSNELAEKWGGGRLFGLVAKKYLPFLFVSP